jgi:two-component system response regulator YesN
VTDMLKVMIVDDEPKVREGLKTIIRWDEYGYRICGECADGIEGLEMIKRLEPDLVLVDIRMPEMDGLEFIEAARQNGAVSRFIILTGYSDFTYTKKAIQLSVDSYLLKPVDEEELIQNLVQLREEIHREKEVRKSLSEAQVLTRDSMVRALMKGDSEKFAEWDSKALGMAGSRFFQVALVHFAGESAGYSLDTIIRETDALLFRDSRNDSFVFDMDGKMCMVFADSDIDRSARLLKEAVDHLRSDHRLQPVVAVGRKADSIACIGSSYADAVRLLDKRFYFDNTAILSWDELKDDTVFRDPCEADKTLHEIDVAKSIDSLYAAAEVTNTGRIKELAAWICRVLRDRKYSEMKMKGFCSNLLNAVYTKALDRYPALSAKLPPDYERVAGIYDRQDICRLEAYIAAQIEILSRAISDADPQTVIKRIIRYIDENYQQDLTLKLLGSLFGYNSCYLGKIIKQHTGCYFNTYLENVRIEHAKRLLLQGYRAADVALKTGFRNIDYFYYKFKKNVGISTSEFRKEKCPGENV